MVLRTNHFFRDKSEMISEAYRVVQVEQSGEACHAGFVMRLA
jgi:hypothetical protein